MLPLRIFPGGADRIMNDNHDICRLDYLVGTLATAYKGMIASLVVKDFCMTESADAATFRGTVLAMPEGAYEASLNQGGVELSRVRLQKGVFEFSTDRGRIASAAALQIDILQAGRHIGTFLLKKGGTGGSYVSATELSEELSGMELTRLTNPLRDKIGLLRKAEDIVSRILSSKKEWPALSEALNGFSIDVFWSAPEVFYGAYDILAHFTLLAAERSGAAGEGKPVSNYLDLLELPLSNEREKSRLRNAAEAWIRELARSKIDFSLAVRRAASALRELHDKLPGLDMREGTAFLIKSLREKNASVVPLDSGIAAAFGRSFPEEDSVLLARFGKAGRNRLLRQTAEAENRLDTKDYSRALELIEKIDSDILDERKAAAVLFDILEKDLATASPDAVVAVIGHFLSAAPGLSARTVQAARNAIPRVLDKLLVLGKAGEFGAVLDKIADAEASLGAGLLLDSRVARSILNSGQPLVIGQFTDRVKRITIPPPRVRGLSTDTWAELVDPLHLERLTGFLDLLAQGGVPAEDVLVHVISNLAICGVLIPDDKLFQRRISAYLNSEAMRGEFLLNFLLLERLPVYFNEVGATSRIRDYSTEIDSWANDPVIYFLRKQIHVNASNHNVKLLEHVLKSWALNAPALLREVVPPDVFTRVDPRLVERYFSVLAPFFTAAGIIRDGELHPEALLELTDEEIDKAFPDREGGDVEARRKAGLACRLYKEVVRKYSLLDRDAAAGDVRKRLRDAIDELRGLRRIVLSPEKKEPEEALYFKRHIAFGIPSVLGTYHEQKFDALCGMMRYGENLPVMLQTIIAGGEAREGDQSGLEQWTAVLGDVWRVLGLYGMQNAQIDEFSWILAHKRLRPAQVLDVLKMWQKELAWLVSRLNKTFHGPLMELIGRIPRDELPEHLRSLETASSDFSARAADVVMRDILNGVPGLVECDRLLGVAVNKIRSRDHDNDERGPEASAHSGPRDYYDLREVPAEEAVRLAPELGTKAKNLISLRGRGLAVPAGVVLPAGRSGSFLDRADREGLLTGLRKAVGDIEARTGKTFGGSDQPLFLSVRSGSYPSMPGILSSILYCGMNERTCDAFVRASGNPELGWDSYRRFIEQYGNVALGLKSDYFEQIMNAYRGKRSLSPERTLSASHLRSIVELYRSELLARGLNVPDDVYEQLLECVCAVYASWQSERARQFRGATGTSDAWGTSVTLMEMISGNQEGGGTSIFFTRDPVTLERAVYGETRENAVGVDLASGRTRSRPLSRAQAASDQISLEDRDPGLFRLHRELADSIEDAFGGLPQEVEATYFRDAAARPELFVLQTRRMEHGEMLSDSFDAVCRMESRVIGRGTGANGGALSGVASFAESPEEIELIKKKSGLPVILIRKTADTDDVSLMLVVKGILTASGGVTSHAAVLAQKFGLSAVVACADLKVNADEQGRPSATLGNALVREGTPLSIDGATGLVFSGTCFPRGTGAKED
jgi:pyruvate, orthophosphate dikinase